jgi:RNA polymerase sigma-70 factor (ECF subfamily)
LVLVVPPPSENFADLADLRRFGLALVRDDKFVIDQRAAGALVDRLFRQTSMEAVETSDREESDRLREDVRIRTYAQFVRLYRRHIRRLTFDDGALGWDENAEKPRESARVGVAAAVRMLPLELREALLVIVLASFTHREAASILDISLAMLISRLTRARERVAALTAVLETTGADELVVRRLSHLRIVK